jgi:TonB family protein
VKSLGKLESSTQYETGPGPAPGLIDVDAANDAQPQEMFDPAGIVVLSTDPELIDAALQVSSSYPSMVFVEEWRALTEEIERGRYGIVLLDMDCVGDTLDGGLAELETSASPPVVVAAGTSNEAPELMRAMADRRIHRLLIKPASPGKVRLLLDAAVNRSLQMREDVRRGASRRSARARPSRPGTRRRGQALGASMALVFLVVVAFGMLWPKSSVPPPAEVSPPVVQPVERPRVEPLPAESAPDPFVDQLERARNALAWGHLVEPAEDNALDGFAAILAEAPEHALARDGLNETIDLLYIWVESALLGEQWELAAGLLDHVRRVRPESVRLAFLGAQVERGRQAEVAPVGRTAAPAQELETLLRQAEARVQSMQLIRPVGDNAFSYYRRAAALDSADPGVGALRLDLGRALVAAAVELLDAGDAEEAAALIRWAGELRLERSIFEPYEQKIAAVRLAGQQEHEAELLRLGLERLREGLLLRPETDSALFHLSALKAENAAHPGLRVPWETLTTTLVEKYHQAVADRNWDAAESWLSGLRQAEADPALVGSLAGELIVMRRQAEFLNAPAPADELELVEFRAPAYPETALRRGAEGWVDLEFIVDRDGRPRDIAVTGAEPVGVFDRAAMQALGRYRYTPFELEGVAYERRVELRMRFVLQ